MGVLTHFVVSEDIARSRDLYANVLGDEVVSENPAVKFANSRTTMNSGGGPTDDKPAGTLTAPDPTRQAAS